MEPTNQQSVAVTGASGYLGGRLAALLTQSGWRVRGLSRRSSSVTGVEHVPFRLGEELPTAALDGVDALVHCAWDFGKRSWPEIVETNVKGSRLLFEAAAAAGVRRTIFVSTVSASGDPRSMYGRAKLLAEGMARERGGMVVRPGLLYGPEPGGMVGMLCQLVRALPIVPVLVGERPPLYLAHEDDICELLRLVAEGVEGEDEVPLVAASPDPHTLREVLAAIATVEGRRRRFVRVPWQLVHLALRGAELARLPLPMRADSALSIGTLDTDPFASGVLPGRVAFRPFEPAVLGEGARSPR